MRIGVGVGPFYASGRVGGSRRSSSGPPATNGEMIAGFTIFGLMVVALVVAAVWPWITTFFVAIWPVLSIVLIVLGVIIAALGVIIAVLGIYGERVAERLDNCTERLDNYTKKVQEREVRENVIQ
jgi:hypothetical protein